MTLMYNWPLAAIGTVLYCEVSNTLKNCNFHIAGTVTLCQANQGSGLTFVDERDNRYFLRGIAVNVFGSRLYCSGKEYNVFVRISQYVQFIFKVIEEVYATK